MQPPNPAEPGPASAGAATHIPRRIEQGDAEASSGLLPPVCDELRNLAGRAFSVRAAGATLQPTVLVHDAFLRRELRSEHR